MIDEAHLASLLKQRALATPDALFAVDADGRELTFAAYARAVEDCALELASVGVGLGSLVSWQMPTTIEALVLAGALSYLGARQNPLLPFLREREVGFIVRQLRPNLLVTPGVWRGFDHGAMANALASNGSGLSVATIDALGTADYVGATQPPGGGVPESGWVFYSSGTTADPKGARHSDATVAVPARAMVGRYRLRADDRIALVFPVTHIGGIAWLLAGLMVGATQIVVPVFDPETTPALLARHGVTQATAGTVFHQAYLAAQRRQPDAPLFPAVRGFPGGGAPKPPQLHHDVKRELGGAGVLSGYGMTEFPIATLASTGDPDDALAQTEGRPTPGVEIRIAAPDGTARPVGEEGEIRLRGPQAFAGYVDAALDAEAFDAEGFLRSGDLGRLDDDGYLTVTGRIKDVIVRKGENLSAKEIEDALAAHPGVADVAVVGLADAERGERACAVVVARGEPLTFEEMTRFLADAGLARQKIPEQLEHTPEIPRNAAGKVEKRVLRERYGGANRS